MIIHYTLYLANSTNNYVARGLLKRNDSFINNTVEENLKRKKSLEKSKNYSKSTKYPNSNKANMT